MALREEVLLDIQAAQAQINRLESDISRLSVSVPVEITGEDKVTQLKQEIDSSSGTVNVGVEDEGLSEADQKIREVRQELGLVDDSADQARSGMQRFGTEAVTSSSRAEAAIRQVKTALVGFGLAFLGTAGISKVISGFNDLTQAAIDNIDAQNAVNAIFKDSAEIIDDFGRKSAQAAGLATSEFQKLATPLGSLLQNFGLSVAESADAAVQLAQRAADLASIYGGQVTDAVAAITSGFQQQTRPLLRYGIALDENTVKAKALELGLGGLNGELTRQQETQARLAAFLDQSAFAAGDFARTADEGANPLRRFRAELSNVAGELGERLLPVLYDMLDAGPALVDTLRDLEPALGLIGEVVGGEIQDLAAFTRLIGEAVSGIAQLIEIGNQVDPGGFLSGFLGQFQDLAVGFLPGKVAQGFFDIRDVLSRGYTDSDFSSFLDDLKNQVQLGVDPVRLLGEAFAGFRDNGRDIVPVLGDIATALGISDEQLAPFIVGLIRSGAAAGVTTEQLRELKDLLNSLFDIDARGTGLNFGRAGRGAKQAGEDINVLADSLDHVFDPTVARQTLEDRFGNLPRVITNVDDLERAAREAGLTVDDLLAGKGGDQFAIVFDDADRAVLELQQSLEGLAAVDPFANFVNIFDPIDEATKTIITDLDLLEQKLLDQATAQANFESNLATLFSQLGPTLGTQLATFLESQGPDAAELAQILVGDPAKAEEIARVLAGQLGDAGTEASKTLAEAIANATPEELASLNAFAAANFLSPQLIQQLLGTGGDMLQVIKQGMDGATISPDFIVDLSAAQVVGVLQTGQIPVHGGFSDTPGAPLPSTPPAGVTQNFEFNYNAQTESELGTATSQSTQTIQAVARGIQRIR